MSDPIILYKSTYCSHSWAVEQFLKSNNISTKAINIDHDHEARQKVMAMNNGFASVPTLIFPDGAQLTEPSLAQLRAKLDIKSPSLSSRLTGFLGNKNWVLFPYILIALVFLADRLAKNWAFAFLSEYGPSQINAFFSIKETYNSGIAFGMFPGVAPFIGWLTIAAVFGMFVYLVRLPKEQWLTRVGLALIIGGALGNMVDRVKTGQVLDFIETPFRATVLNVADIAINAGMIIVIAATAWSIKQTQARNPIDI